GALAVPIALPFGLAVTHFRRGPESFDAAMMLDVVDRISSRLDGLVGHGRLVLKALGKDVSVGHRKAAVHPLRDDDLLERHLARGVDRIEVDARAGRLRQTHALGVEPLPDALALELAGDANAV